MPRAFLHFLLLVAGAQAAAATIEQEIDAADEQLRQAFLHADAASLDHLLADNWKVVHVNGRQQNKAQFIESLQSGRAKFLSIQIDERELRVFGDTAIVTARWTNTIEFKGNRSSGQDRVTRVWVKLPEGWRAVTEQAVYLEPSNKAPTADDDEKEVLRLMKQMQDAWLKHDVDAVSALVADEVQYWSFKGVRRGKADLLKMVARNREATTQADDPQVRVFGDTAIYTARITDSGTDDKGAPFNSTTLVTTVLVRRDGSWRIVQDHESLIQK
jgi:uncharacterized protein (TIGR02246 family)